MLAEDDQVLAGNGRGSYGGSQNPRTPTGFVVRLKAEVATVNSRIILSTGFGGLLFLMGYTGVDAVQNLNRIRNSDNAIRGEFLARNKALNQIRSDVYLSGTYLRDYILEPDAALALRHRASLERIRLETDAGLVRYASLIPREQLEPVAVLRRQLASYWQVAAPALNWSADERRAKGYSFLRDEVLPRRSTMLGLADRIDAVNERQLNAGEQRVSLLFADFRGSLTVTIGVNLALGFVLAAFSFYRVRQLERQEERAKGKLKELSARLVEVQENERRAISRELHDEVGQALSALLVGLSNLNAAVAASASDEVKTSLEAIRHLAGNSVNVVRNMSLLLRPSMLDDLGLLPAVEWQAREVSRQTGMRVAVTAEEAFDELPDTHKTCIFRLVQEALQNCSRHSHASTVRIIVGRDSQWVRLSVQDDGKGFNVAREKGLGLLGMEERVTGLGGEFKVRSEPGFGTLVAVGLPLEQVP